MQYEPDRPVDEPVDERDDGTWNRPPLSDVSSQSYKPPKRTEPLITPTIIRPRPGDSNDSGNSENSQGRGRDGTGSSAWNAAPPPVIQEGQVIFDKYQIIELLGEGGMGQVWLVHNIELDRRSALKLIWPKIAQNDHGWQRFQREAQLMAKLNHPNAVAVYDYKRTHSMAYIEMEYVRGRSLNKILEERKGQPMPLDWIAQILDQLCAVLQEAHGHVDEKTGKPKPIIHRDLKPSNLMLVDTKPPGQNLKVLDFGIAKMIDDEESQDQQLTAAGEFLGTVGYSSPEQIQGGSWKGDRVEIDGRSDLYSVGVLLYQLLTGTLPFKGDRMRILAAHLTQPPPLMKQANPTADVPPKIERVVMRCLEKDPNKRPQSARELAEKFRAALPTPKLFRWKLAIPGLCLLATMIFVVLRPRPPSPGTRKTPLISRDSQYTAPLSKPGWQLRDDRYQVAEHTAASPEGPMYLVRKSDGFKFKRLDVVQGVPIYLPDGYEPEDPDDRAGGNLWPRVIIRTKDKEKAPKDKVRFIRVLGKTFLRGDPRQRNRAKDSDRTPCALDQGVGFLPPRDRSDQRRDRGLSLGSPRRRAPFGELEAAVRPDEKPGRGLRQAPPGGGHQLPHG